MNNPNNQNVLFDQHYGDELSPEYTSEDSLDNDWSEEEFDEELDFDEEFDINEDEHE